jgi:hypothetical protein
MNSYPFFRFVYHWLGGCDLCTNRFCRELGADLLGKVFSNFARVHEILEDFWRDTRILVHKSRMKFYLQDFCTLIISHRAQNPGFNGLSFQVSHYALTRALNG